jgi:1-aminocyclopropane-1-carboxylate deaminase/D-cysteine desulfhydrase-like pyridoxal-dependent ACC family enzyme
MLAIAAVVQYHNTQLEQLSQICPKNTTISKQIMSPPNEPFQRRRFIYYTKKLPSFLRNQPSGNLFRALSLGMELVEVSNEEYNNLSASVDQNFIDTVAPMQLQPPIYGDSVWIPQGGACSMAVVGTNRLAQEIYEYWSKHGNNQPLSVCIPGGTCSTALFVHHALQTIQASKPIQERLDIEVVVIPCVGDEVYAQRQMMNLNVQIFGQSNEEDFLNNIPTILRPTPINDGTSMRNQCQHPNLSPNTVTTAASELDMDYTSKNNNDYYRFGEPNADILQTYREFRDEYDILIDLLYGAPSWTILLRHWTSSMLPPSLTSITTNTALPLPTELPSSPQKRTECSTTDSRGPYHTFNPIAPLDGRRVMYVHSGGVEGINSQLLRYKHQNLIGIDEIQLPGRNNK